MSNNWETVNDAGVINSMHQFIYKVQQRKKKITIHWTIMSESWVEVVRAFRRNATMRREVLRPKPLAIPSNVTRHSIPIDDALLRQIVAEISKSKLSRMRIGQDWQPDASVVLRQSADDDVWIPREGLRSLDDICTRFTTKRFFPDAYSRMNMIVNVVRVYDHLAKLMKQQYYIVFKGGVMMRLLILEFFKDLHVDVRYEAIEYVSDAQKAVGVSDFDFEIVPIDRDCPETETWNHVFINSVCLLWLRNYINDYLYKRPHEQGTRVLMNAEWDYGEAEHELKEMLRAEVKTLPNHHPLKYCVIDHVHITHPDRPPPELAHQTRMGTRKPGDRFDFVAFKCKDGNFEQRCIVPLRDVMAQMGCSKNVQNLANQSKAMYVSTNLHIGELEPRGHSRSMRGNFHLSRIKHSFLLYYTTKNGEQRIDRLSGEVIDLSQTHGGHLDERHATQLKNTWTSYTISDFPEAKVRSYTISAILHDLQDVIHRGEQLPWQNKKIHKRLLRYAIFLVLATRQHDSSPKLKIDALDRCIDYLRSPERIERQRMKRTGISELDTFAEQEFLSLKAHGVSPAATRYYQVLRSHLMACVNFIKKDETLARTNTWSTTPLNAIHVVHDDL